MDAMESGLAFWARRVDPHAIKTKISRSQEFRFVAPVKAILAKAFCQA
jgi:hypothetical protein